MFTFHNVILLVLFLSGFGVGCWSMQACVRGFFRWFRARRSGSGD